MAIEILDFPIKNGGSFHSKLLVYQRVPQFLAPFFTQEIIQVFQRCAREMAAMRRGWVTASGFPQFGWFKWDMEKSWGNHEKMMGKNGNTKNDWQMMGEYIDLYGINLWDYCGIMIDALSQFQNVAAFNYPSIHIIWISLKSRYTVLGSIIFPASDQSQPVDRIMRSMQKMLAKICSLVKWCKMTPTNTTKQT